jgi:hypothetical protein
VFDFSVNQGADIALCPDPICIMTHAFPSRNRPSTEHFPVAAPKSIPLRSRKAGNRAKILHPDGVPVNLDAVVGGWGWRRTTTPRRRSGPRVVLGSLGRLVCAAATQPWGCRSCVMGGWRQISEGVRPGPSGTGRDVRAPALCHPDR